MEDQEEKAKQPNLKKEYDSETGINRTTEIITDEDGDRYEIIKEFKCEVIKVSKAIARRKTFRKFGGARDDPVGPNASNTYPGEEIFLNFIQESGEEQTKETESLLNSTRAIATCRICKGAHFTHRCPFRDSRDLNPEGRGNEAAEADAAAAAGAPRPGGLAGGGGGSKYVPPSMRGEAGKAAGAALLDKRRDDQFTIRVTNLPEDTKDSDLNELFSPFGKIQRVYLAKDKISGASKGFAFITYLRRDDAQRAIAGVSGYGYDHLILKVEWARPTPTT